MRHNWTNMVEELEGRRMFSASVHGNLLSIVGTKHADVIEITRYGSAIDVVINGIGKIFNGNGVNGLLVKGGGGNDLVRNRTSLSSELLGGAGNDTLLGGSGSDVISGGSGNDVISGGRGNDLLNGDAGKDTITGGRGSDFSADALDRLQDLERVDGNFSTAFFGGFGGTPFVNGGGLSSALNDVLGGSSGSVFGGGSGSIFA